MGEPEPLTVDAVRYARRVAEQRNTALDQVAQLSALLEDVIAERDQLAAELAALRQPPAS